MDPYLLLEVPYTASNSDFKKAYHRLAKRYHPDKNGGRKDAEEKFKQINSAYECLTDKKKRAAIDAKRWDQEKAEAAKKVREEAARQARSYAQPSQPSRTHLSPLAAMLALIAFVFLIVALFGSSNNASNSTTA